MARPTKSEQKAKAKAKAEEAAKKAKENAKAQEELARRAEERNKKKVAEILEKNKRISSQENTVYETKSVEQTSEINHESELEIKKSNEQITIDEVNESNSGANNEIPDISHQMDIPEEIAQELNVQKTSDDYNIPNDDFDPLKEKVIRRLYTDGNLGASNNQVSAGENISSNQEQTQQVSAEGNLGNTTQPVIEPEIEEPIIKPQEPKIEIGDMDDIGSNSQSSSTSQPKTEKSKTTSINPNLEDLSPSQKRKAAEKTADALITTYTNLVPIPFKAISSFNMRKLEQRHLKDEIDINMVIMDDGTKVRDYCEGVNQQVEETFVITKEMQDEIREPLIDVLLENNFALTPTQRLIMVVGGQIVQMGITAIQFMQQNKNAMETFKKFHEENKAMKKNQNTTEQKQEQSQARNQTSSNTDDISNFKNDDNLDIPSNEEETSGVISVEEYLESK